MGKFVISKNRNGGYWFNLLAGNSQKILTSELYSSRASCESGIASVRENASKDERYDRKLSKDGKPFFNLLAANGFVIGMSEQYESKESCENGIEAVKINVPGAVVEDQSS